MKILFIDTETGGVNTQNSALIQISGIVRIDRLDIERFNFFVKPYPGLEVTDKALAIQGRSRKEIENYEYETVVYKKLKEIFDRYIDKYDRTDKFIVAGYNVRFDIEILNSLFKRHNDNYLFSYIESTTIDPLQIIGFLQLCNKLPFLENNKLETWCKYFNIKLNAHDSMEDIVATKKLIFKIVELIEVRKNEKLL